MLWLHGHIEHQTALSLLSILLTPCENDPMEPPLAILSAARTRVESATLAAVSNISDHRREPISCARAESNQLIVTPCYLARFSCAFAA